MIGVASGVEDDQPTGRHQMKVAEDDVLHSGDFVPEIGAGDYGAPAPRALLVPRDILEGDRAQVFADREQSIEQNELLVEQAAVVGVDEAAVDDLAAGEMDLEAVRERQPLEEIWAGEKVAPWLR